jgi:molybdate transport system substrate-binding protein
LLILSTCWQPAWSAQARVAVAANFAEVLQALTGAFEQAHDHRLETVAGSTGRLYAQIIHGAPFDVLLAADQERPERLIASGHALAESRFTYAVGRLALWSLNAGGVGSDGGETLRQGGFRKLAIANPKLAPYGAAAVETLAGLAILQRVQPRLVLGENIGQTYAMVATGNADMGFVALSQLRSARHGGSGSLWIVPEALHHPIRQDAVLLIRGRSNPAAEAFLDFLRQPAVRARIEAFGYGSS